MPVSEAQKRATLKYMKTNYDRVELKVPKGKKDEIKAHAEKHQPQVGEFGKAGYSPAGSLQGFINRAIDETMERDKAPTTPEPSSKQAGKPCPEMIQEWIKLTDNGLSPRDIEKLPEAGGYKRTTILKYVRLAKEGSA